MSGFKAKLKHICQLQLVITSRCVNQFWPLSGLDRMSGLIWVNIVWKVYQQMTMSFKSLTHNWNISVHFQLAITSKVSNSLDPYQVRTECPAWSGSKLFESVVSRWQVMSRFNAKKNTSVHLQLVITSKVSNCFDPYQVRAKCQAWFGSELLERVISRWKCHVKV